jgi:hypothetical protein
MPHPPANATQALPTWLAIVGSLVIVGHLAAVLVGVLAAPSGPWPSPEGPVPATPPQFAFSLNQTIAPNYLRPLHLAHTYRFPSNNPGGPGVQFTVVLKDKAGETLETLQYPDPQENFWVRHRQSLLAGGLAPDQPVEPMGGEAVAAPGQQLRKVGIWEMVESKPGHLKIHEVPEHLIPRDHPVMRPRDWSWVLARSYVRYLCRTHGAASAELIRHTQDSIPPMALFMDAPPAGGNNDLISNFGELPQ